MSAGRQVASGVKWSSVSQIGRQISQLLTTLILARLLNPEDFGLIGMAMVAIGFVAVFQDLGTSAAVVHLKNLSEELLSSIFWVNGAFGLLAMLVLILLSSVIADFYHEPRVKPLLQVLSITFFISGLSILQQALFQREFAFNKLAKLEIASTLFGATVGIFAALLGYGVWSLVFQALAVALATTVLLWSASYWRPKPVFHWREVKAVSAYSLNLTGFSIFNYFTRNADYLLIGKFLGAQDLGYYTLAYRIILYPLQTISSVIGRVTFPFYSKIQDDNARFRAAYLKVARTIALITFPMMFGLWALAEPIVLTAFGLQWKPIILLLLILAPVGMAQSIGSTVGTIYQAKGRTDWMFRWGVFTGTLAVSAFLIGLRWGVVGVAAAYAVINIILVYPNFAIPLSLINVRVSALWKALWPTFLNSFLMFLFLLFLKAWLPVDLGITFVLGISVTAGLLFYICASMMLNLAQLKEVVAIVISAK